MTLKKGFLNTTPIILDLSVKNIVTGMSLGLIYAFTFYAFVFCFREAFRLFTINEYHDIMILTRMEMRFYNLFYAFLSVIFGQSLCFNYWFDRPKKPCNKRNYLKTSIVNDQRVLNWYFLFWFTKLTIVFASFFCIYYESGFDTLSFYPHYKYVFVLIIVVLFFQTWNTIRYIFKGKSTKWQVSSILFLSSVAYGLSFVNIIDYNTINKTVLSKNIFHTYQLKLPVSCHFEKYYNKHIVEQIYVVNSKETAISQEPVIVFKDEKIAIHDLQKHIIESLSSRKEHERHHLGYLLLIQHSTKMKFVNQITKALSNAGVYRIAFAVSPENTEYHNPYYRGHNLPIRLPMRNSSIFDIQRIINNISHIPNNIEIKQEEGDRILVNHISITEMELKPMLKQLIQSEPDHIIKYYINDDTHFSEYITVLANAKKAVDELRNDYSMDNFSIMYTDLESDQRLEVRRKYPFRLFELSPDLMELVKKTKVN